MKRLIMLSGTVLCLLLGVDAVQAQRSTATASGHFAVRTASSENVEVKYQVSPAYPENVLLEIQTSASFLFNAHIINEKGIEVAILKSEPINLRYANSIDISKLAKGNYFIEVFTGAGKTESIKIPFTK